VRKILFKSNRDLLYELQRVRAALVLTDGLPSELQGYREWLLLICDSLTEAIEENFERLSAGEDSILVDILSETNVIARQLNFLNSTFIDPVLRTKNSDLLALRILSWLHSSHSVTKDTPFAVSGGMFACLPFRGMPTIYFTPCSAHSQLLYLPLLFHEFGHVLYAFHKTEMDALVKELQQKIATYLQPTVSRNDRYSQEAARKRDEIAVTWFEWTQELFCDAVGLSIGGPAFLHAFSMCFRILGREEFHLPQESLVYRTHPVSWIRIKVLARRAEEMGYSDLAAELCESWSEIASCFKITEEYYGFFNDSFLPMVDETINDMLVEAQPLDFRAAAADGASPIKLFNQTWDEFLRDNEDFIAWENGSVREFLAATKPRRLASVREAL
jgi:hypothetical protein